MSYLEQEDILSALTPRERDVIERIARGLEIKEIAHDLGIGYHTVKMFIHSAKSKLGARNQLELVILMYGGKPDSMPDEHKHPLHYRRSIDRDPSWQGHLRYSVSHR